MGRAKSPLDVAVEVLDDLASLDGDMPPIEYWQAWQEVRRYIHRLEDELLMRDERFSELVSMLTISARRNKDKGGGT